MQPQNPRNFAGGITLAGYLADSPSHAGGPSVVDAPQPHFEPIATRGYEGWKHLVLGSTTARVARAAPCPVLVVREKEHDFV